MYKNFQNVKLTSNHSKRLLSRKKILTLKSPLKLSNLSLWTLKLAYTIKSPVDAQAIKIKDFQVT